jgi:hypothetical protein
VNERIEQLAEQCWTHINEPLFGAKSPHWEFDRQKFAELIVRECIEVVKWTPSQFPNDEYVKNIKEHFGVEE